MQPNARRPLPAGFRPRPPTTDPTTQTPAAREQRQAAWQGGVEWCAGDHLVRRALADCPHEDDYARFLFLQGIADTLTAAGRNLAGLDARKGPGA
jgi:hypothetical protein